MQLARVIARARVGIHAPEVAVEVHLSSGLPSMSIVGLPETAVKESRDRVRSAIINSGFEFPRRRIVVNLAPAELPKEGGRFDLAIALALLQASGQLPDNSCDHHEFLGELALNGELRPVNGVLPASMAAIESERVLVVPDANAVEAGLPRVARIVAVNSLLSVCLHLAGQQRLDFFPTGAPDQQSTQMLPDMTDVKGQVHARKALEVAASGLHNLLFFGPPGTGKTLLASRLPGILPPLDDQQKLEVAAIHSVAGQIRNNWSERPFRSPHHTASGVALVGGGVNPRPGEISLAHHGVLFLDELPEFPRSVLDVLREPLENGEIRISRASGQVTYPAHFQLIAAMNPSPGGYEANDPRSSHFSPQQVRKYLGRVSGPFLDRIDLQVEVSPVPPEVLSDPDIGESSQIIRKRVCAALMRQLDRQGKANSLLSPSELTDVCRMNAADLELLHQAMHRLKLSARSYHRILKITRTLADMAGYGQPEREHLMQALGFRQLDRLLG